MQIVNLKNGLAKKSEVFLNGIDIFHCCYFTQWSPFCGDIMITEDGVDGVSYLLSAERDLRKKRIFIPQNNDKNIKLVPLYELRKKIK